MDYEEIIKEIKKGLTGDPETDIKYLEGKISEYEDNADSGIIAGECGQMIYELLPDSLKEEFSFLDKSLRLGIDEYSTEAALLLKEGKTEDAAKKLEEGIKLFEGSDLYSEKDGIPFYDFRKPVEEALYRTEHGMDKRIKLLPEPVVGLYRMYAGILYGQKEHAKALGYLEKALRYNPYHQKTGLEYSDHFRELGDLERYKQILSDSFKIAYEPQMLAGIYRRLGWYFSERSEWEPAWACTVLAERYNDENEISETEKKYITENAGEGFKVPSDERAADILKMNGIPYGPDRNILRIVHASGEAFKEAGNDKAAGYFFEIEKGLTK